MANQIYTDTPPTAPDLANQYWAGNITRAESQKVFDEFGAFLMQTQQSLMKLDLLISVIVDKLGMSVTELQAAIQKKLEDARAAAPVPAAEPEKKSSLVITD